MAAHVKVKGIGPKGTGSRAYDDAPAARKLHVRHLRIFQPLAILASPLHTTLQCKAWEGIGWGGWGEAGGACCNVMPAVTNGRKIVGRAPSRCTIASHFLTYQHDVKYLLILLTVASARCLFNKNPDSKIKQNLCWIFSITTVQTFCVQTLNLLN